MLTLGTPRTIDENLLNKVIRTICAIANNGPGKPGKVIIGVTDTDADAERIRELDRIEPRRVGKRFVVGVNREARLLGLSVEDYYAKWKHSIKTSGLSNALKDSVLSNMDFNSYFDLGVIVITIPAQTRLSLIGEDVYWRNGDATQAASQTQQIIDLASRFHTS